MANNGITATAVGSGLSSIATAAAPLATAFPIGTIAVGVLALAGAIFSFIGKKRANKEKTRIQTELNENKKKDAELTYIGKMTDNMGQSFSNILGSFDKNNKNQFSFYS